ncbi:MAG: hypothetical protein KJ907_04030 [Actinobacteria bacterium]|nr:hypothetical protein [Actinomycetota bacterium]
MIKQTSYLLTVAFNLEPLSPPPKETATKTVPGTGVAVRPSTQNDALVTGTSASHDNARQQPAGKV